MKKIIILMLASVQFGIYAQLSPNGNLPENDLTNNTYAEKESYNPSDTELVYATENKVPSYGSNKFSDSSDLNGIAGGYTEDDLPLIRKNLIKNSNSDLGEGMVTFSKDGKTVFFSVNRKIKNWQQINEKEVKIKKAVMLHLFKANIDENGRWMNIEMLPFNSNQYSTGHPALNSNDTKLYFVSDGPESLGRTDIFVVDLHRDGTYGIPINLGSKINSKEREILPFIDKDNLLYFSSDARNKQGELDVFACKIFDHSITTPVKLKGAVNIGQDEFDFNKDNQMESGYFSTNSLAAKNVDHIYALVDTSPLDIDCQQEISGLVRNEDTQELLTNVQIRLFDTDDNEIQASLSGEADGSFSFNQSCNNTYKLKGYMDGYLIGELDITTVNDLNAAPIEIVLNMKKAPVMEVDLIVEEPESLDADNIQAGLDKVVTNKTNLSYEEPIINSKYNFKSQGLIFTVQIGAFKGKVQTEQYINLSSSYNHTYDDGFNRYFSGVFESRLEAKKYLIQMKNMGYNDAFIVGLKGENRF